MGCVNPGCRLRASRICPILCAHPLPKSLLRASIKLEMAFLVARIGAQDDPCVHPFQKWPLRASVFRVTKNQHLNPNISNFGFYNQGFTTAIGFQYPILVFEGVHNWLEPFLMPLATWTLAVSAVRAILYCKKRSRRDSWARLQIFWQASKGGLNAHKILLNVN